MKVLRRCLTNPLTACMLILAAAAGWKTLLLALDAIPFNADEAVVALMARHILQGERPIFFYGQAYMGSLDAYLVAGGFWLFGQQVWVIRMVQAMLYLGTIITTITLGKEMKGGWKVGLIAALLMSIPTVNVTLYTTASLGGYGEALLIGNLTMLTSLRIANADWDTLRLGRRIWVWLLLGILVGVGLWANGLTLVYSIPSIIFLSFFFFHRRNEVRGKRLWVSMLFGGAGFALGSSPWWIYAFTHGWQALLTELMGSAVAVEQVSWLERIFNHIVNFSVLGGTVVLGLRPPWEVRWLGLPLLPFVLAAWMVTIVYALAQLRKGIAQDWGRWLMLGVVVMLSLGFIFTSFGVDPSGRYFLPFAIPLCLAAADAIIQLIHFPVWRGVVIAMILIYQGWGTLESAFRNPPGITTQFDTVSQIDTGYQRDLIAFLRKEGEIRGYSNYWVSYPMAFLTEEEILFIPRLPYHEDLRYTSRDDRYQPYDDIVSSSQRIAYITTKNQPLDERLVRGLRISGVTWQEQLIGDYHVYYDLSRAIRPEELGL